MNKIALICGISGQDGAYLTKLLLEKNYKVWGTSRDAQGNRFEKTKMLGVHEKVNFISMAPEDFRSVWVVINKVKPDEIYYLAGQSSVGLSFELPAETIQSIAIGILNILEACRMVDYKIRLYHAGSSEVFGDTMGQPADEKTPFTPRSPYAVAKASATWLVNNYREAYSLFVCTGILFNHESPLRPQRFVTQKIISEAIEISKGKRNKLNLGRLDIQRDWGWAGEYVEAMWLMLQQDEADDYIIATGETHSLEDFVKETFAQLNLEYLDFVEQDKTLFRPTDILVSKANPQKAKLRLNWQVKVQLKETIHRMLNQIF